jgi:hypothetical protein
MGNGGWRMANEGWRMASKVWLFSPLNLPFKFLPPENKRFRGENFLPALLAMLK